MIRTIGSSFLLGLSFGWGPCLISCGPLLLTYLAGAKKDVRKSIFSYIIFSISRMLVYACMGVAVYFLGRFIFEHLNFLFRIILVLGGLFVILLSVLMALNKDIGLIQCDLLRKNLIQDSKKSMIILGLVTGFLPCAPLLTMLTYAGLVSKNVIENLVYVAAFGLGTSLSPLIIFAGFTGLLPKFLGSSRPGLSRILNFFCSVIILTLGIQLIRRAF
jgi:thiol:disulfide interchange protein DsbD